MERKVKKRYIRPDFELLECEVAVLGDIWSNNTGNGEGNVNNDDPENTDELSRQGGFMDFEESDYDY